MRFFGESLTPDQRDKNRTLEEAKKIVKALVNSGWGVEVEVLDGDEPDPNAPYEVYLLPTDRLSEDHLRRRVGMLGGRRISDARWPLEASLAHLLLIIFAPEGEVRYYRADLPPEEDLEEWLIEEGKLHVPVLALEDLLKSTAEHAKLRVETDRYTYDAEVRPLTSAEEINRAIGAARAFGKAARSPEDLARIADEVRDPAYLLSLGDKKHDS